MRDEAWDSFAAREPYFAVITDPRYLRAHFDADASAAFFGGGENQVDDVLRFIRAHGAPLFAPRSVLEYGCGPGRLLVPFARNSERAVGVDISPAMLETARQHAAASGAQNVELLDAARFETDPRRFDLVNCYLVLQRMPRAAGLALLRRLAQRVRDGGFLVAHLPFRARTSALRRVTRAVRAHVPGVNAAVNAMRGNTAGMPLTETTVYDLNDVLELLHEEGFDRPLLRYLQHGDVDSVIVHAQREHRFGASKPGAKVPDAWEEPVRDAGFVDVRRLIAETPIEELNRKAEEYFASLTGWDEHLAKPFARIADVPQLLIGLGVLMQGMSLVRGMTVLEYGAGTGWLSRYLTQLGCRAILLDVSPTALQIARALFERQPVIGEQPKPEFLVYDGRKIDLPDASVDRILCFDAFHHAPNPAEVLAEFKRVLKPGGIAGFAEPGPWHSTTPQSQFEMRTYGVVENDVDIHALWQAAAGLGFADLRLAAFNVPPFQVSLAEYDELLAAGDAFAHWADHTRQFMTAVRTFFLRTEGAEAIDSRHPEGLRAEIQASLISEPRAGEPVRLRVTVRNAGTATWLPSPEPVGGVSIGVHLYAADGSLVRFDLPWTYLPKALAPGESLEMEAGVPALEPGSYILEVDCVANGIAWFAQVGSRAQRLPLVVIP